MMWSKFLLAPLILVRKSRVSIYPKKRAGVLGTPLIQFMEDRRGSQRVRRGTGRD